MAPKTKTAIARLGSRQPRPAGAERYANVPIPTIVIRIDATWHAAVSIAPQFGVPLLLLRLRHIDNHNGNQLPF